MSLVECQYLIGPNAIHQYDERGIGEPDPEVSIPVDDPPGCDDVLCRERSQVVAARSQLVEHSQLRVDTFKGVGYVMEFGQHK